MVGPGGTRSPEWGNTMTRPLGRRLAVGVVGAAGMVLGVLATAGPAAAAPRNIQAYAPLVGVNQVDRQGRLGAGDPDGSGNASITLQNGNRLCYSLTVTGIARATAARIHEGAARSNGRAVLTLKAPTRGASSQCVKVGRGLWDGLAEDPGRFYVNVSNDEYRNGAVRGQVFAGLGPSPTPDRYEPPYNPACRSFTGTVADGARYHATVVPSEQRGVVAFLPGRSYDFRAYADGPNPTRPGATGRWYHFGGYNGPVAQPQGWIWSGYVSDAQPAAVCAAASPPALQPRPVPVPRPACWFTGTLKERTSLVAAPFSNHGGATGYLPAGTKVTFADVRSYAPGSPYRAYGLGGDPNQYARDFFYAEGVALDGPVPAGCPRL